MAKESSVEEVHLCNRGAGSDSLANREEHVSKTPVVANPAPPPDAGVTAWLQCVGAFFLFFNCWGLVNAFGVFETFYLEQYLPNATPSQISWIGSVGAFWLQFGSIVTGPLLDLGYLRLLIAMGTFLTVFGFVMTSIATQYWQVLLAQGFCAGFGFSCLFMPSIGILPTLFLKKRSLTVGIAASGSSVGAIIYSVMFHELQPRLGFGWVVRVIAFVALATLFIPFAVMKQRLKPPKARQLWDASAFHDPVFLMCAVALFFAFLGLYIPFFDIQVQALQEGIITGNLNFYLLVFINAGSIFGRLLPNYAADKIGPMNTLLPCTVVASILAFVWIGIRNTGGLAVFCVLFGFFSGTFVSIAPVVTANISPNLALFGTRNGMLSVLMGIGLLIGNPIAAAIIGTGGYTGLQAFCGVCSFAAAFGLLVARIKKAGLSLTIKA